MMRLMVEQVREDFAYRLLVRVATELPILVHALKVGVIQCLDELADAFVLDISRGAQPSQIVKDDGIESIRVIALAVKPMHPDTIRCQEMI